MSLAWPAEERKLYYISGSPYALRAQLALTEKGIPFTAVLLDATNGGLGGDLVRRVNPRGQSPSFADGPDVRVHESLAILHYLEAVYTDAAPLMPPPSDPAARARVLQRMHESDALMVPVLACLYSVFGNPPLYPKLDLDTDDGARRLRDLNRRVAAELLAWEGHLAAGAGTAAGGGFTAADCALAPAYLHLWRLGGEALFASLPQGKRYVEMLLERPSVRANWPPHWQRGPARPPFSTVHDDLVDLTRNAEDRQRAPPPG
ncbi:unnamed protein product [Pedinophyceae sp. YPF-701]|nr:unnamed protein product [Pedinophyceae sp. YPF-701]